MRMAVLWRTYMMGVLLMGLSLGQQGLAADLDWKLKKDRDGIKAYTAKVEGNEHLAFKGETLLKGKTLDQVIAVMRDVPGMDKWLHTCYDAMIIKEEAGMSRIVHMKNSTPTFLVAERDLVLRQAIERTSPTTAIMILTGLPDEMAPQKGFVRIPYFDGKWEFEQQAGGVRAVYSGVIDPGGGLPTSVTNMLVVDTPFETLKNLAAVMAR